MIVLDASALLALLRDEPGADVVAESLATAVMSVANVAEVLGKAVDRGLDMARERLLVESLGIRLEPVTMDDAVASARLRSPTTASQALSLGDRLCLALALRLDLPVLTADRVWADLDLGVDVELVR